MHRFFVKPQQISRKGINFPPDLTHQILHVLRLADGDLVEVLNNDGYTLLTRLHFEPNENRLFGEILERNFFQSEPRVALHLYFGLSNREKIEWILQKGTEIGVSVFCPYVSSRTLVQTTELSDKRQKRWDRIIREAAEQSHRGKLPILKNPIELKKGFFDSIAYTKQCLLAWEGADPHNDRLAAAIQPQNEDALAVFVGPEGGFSDDEIHWAESSGIKLVSLGSRVLRMETAAIVFPALILFVLDEM